MTVEYRHSRLTPGGLNAKLRIEMSTIPRSPVEIAEGVELRLDRLYHWQTTRLT